MVVYGFGLDINEQIEEEKRCSQSVWQGEKERVAKTTPESWRTVFYEIYSSTPHERLTMTPSKFVDEIAWRFYTEGCLNKDGFNPDKYNGEALKEFVARESYFALERATKKGLLEQPPLNENSVEKISTKVLESIVKRAIELFSDWKGDMEPPKGSDDKRNLRDNLEAYIGF